MTRLKTLLLFGLLCISSWHVTAIAEQTQPYLLAPEDVLEISVWKEEGLQKEVLVRPDGVITFPLIGDVQASGKTIEQLRDEITKRLEEKYISNPAVSISLLKVGGNQFYVIGQVNRPGQYMAGHYIDVMQALSIAGGLTPFAAKNKIIILRRSNGKVRAIPFEYNDIESGKHLEQNIILKDGDTLVVP
jgi:polysaccharide export outer membrane protein